MPMLSGWQFRTIFTCLLDDFQRLSIAPASITGLLLGEGIPQLLFMNLTSGVLPGMGK